MLPCVLSHSTLARDTNMGIHREQTVSLRWSAHDGIHYTDPTLEADPGNLQGGAYYIGYYTIYYNYIYIVPDMN
jgi:hypothetical protein